MGSGFARCSLEFCLRLCLLLGRASSAFLCSSSELAIAPFHYTAHECSGQLLYSMLQHSMSHNVSALQDKLSHC